MDQPTPQLLRLPGKYARSKGIDGANELRLALGLIDGGIGSGIDDHIRSGIAHGLRNIVQTGEVATLLPAINVQRDQLAQGRKTALQFPAYLTTFTKQQNLHQLRPW